MIKNDWNSVLEDYYLEEKRKNRRPQTLISLRRKVRKLFTYLDELSLELFSFTYKEAKAYQLWLIDTGRKDGMRFCVKTIKCYITSAKSFYSYLKTINKIMENPFSGLKPIRDKKKVLAGILKESQMSELLLELENFDTGITGETPLTLKEKMSKYRTHVIAELLYSTGMRIGEVGYLKEEDIDLAKGRVHVKEGKGGKMRTCFLNPFAVVVLGLYIKRIRNLLLGEQHNKELLFGVNFKNISFAVNNVVSSICKKKKLPRIRCHGFRHAVGYHLLKQGCGIRYIQEILGHDCIRSTEVYTHVDKEDLRNVLDHFHPRQWRKV